MGNTNAKTLPRPRNKKQVHWKAADRPAPPGTPYLQESDVTPDVLTIKWDRPVRDGGSPITGYLVEHRRTGSPHWVKASPTLVPFNELTLSGLEPGWRYQFRVFAVNVVGMSDSSDLSEPLTVTLQRSAITAPRFIEELQDAVALENEKVEFVAHFLGQPPPKVCWFKDGFEIFSSRRTRILTEPDRSVLTIHQSALADEGEIKCTATNKAGHASTKAKLTLEAPPSIRLPRQYEDGLLFEIGEAMRLKVSVAGKPNPLVFWSHNGESIQNDERYEVEDSEKSSTLKVNEAQRSDRGEYQIKAVNKLGEDVVSFLVTVTDKPSPPGKARVVMTLGRSVTLSWNTPEDDGGCKIGNYIVEYYRLGWNVWLKAATTRQLTTVLGDLIEGSEYKFRVKAESPYGISDPSEESDLVFIPDPKRGLLSPPARSRSQPRDNDLQPPVAAKRKKARSQSSSRAETAEIVPVLMDNGVPIRPQRAKTKSHPTSPEPSPRSSRKDVAAEVNKEFYDRSSMARELAYGSPEMKFKKSDPTSSDYNKPRTPSPKFNQKHERISPQRSPNFKRDQISAVRSIRKSPSPQPPSPKQRTPSPNIFSTKAKSPSPTPSNSKKHPRVSNQDTWGSSEFMLVLMPNSKQSHGSQSDLGFELDDNGIPPPLSLSAPELGAEPPALEYLLRSASSTELLHERAMIRFYKEAALEEAEINKRKEKLSGNDDNKHSPIPKIQVNSKDQLDLVGLERKHSLRRRLSAGGTVPQQILWAQRRHSLRNSSELNELIDPKILKRSLTPEKRKELLLTRQRSESEEREEEEFERIRAKMTEERKKQLTPKSSIEVVEEEKWEMDSNEGQDYEESLSEEEFSEDERFMDRPLPPLPSEEEEGGTYHPRMDLMTARLSDRKNDEPFEILNKPSPLPDPNFIPKPILKKRDQPGFTDDKMPKDLLPSRAENKFSLEEEKEISRERSASLTSEHMWNTTNALRRLEVTQPPDRPVSPRQRSLSLAPNLQKPPAVNLPDRRGSLTSAIDELTSQIGKKPAATTSDTSNTPGIMSGISAIAGITGLAAATIVIPRHLMDRKKHEEETKVIVDRYAEIVTQHSIKRRYDSQSPPPKSQPSSYNRPRVESPPSAHLPARISDAYNTPKLVEKNRSFEKTSVTENTAEKLGATFGNRSPSRSSKSSEMSSLSEPFDRTPSPSISKSSQENLPSPSNSLSRKDAALGLQSITKAGMNSLQQNTHLQQRFATENRDSSSPEIRKASTSKKDKVKLDSSREDFKDSGFISTASKTSEVHIKYKRQLSPSPMRTTATQVELEPKPHYLRPPKMREIMTQTSTEIRAPVPLTLKQEELQAQAQVKVRSVVDYLTDLAMFSVACWFYFFSNELYAIPVLLVMVYRQLHEAVKKKMPKWKIPKYFRRTEKNS